MNTHIAASIIVLSSSGAVAGSFDFERQVDTPALFPTLTSEQSTAKETGRLGSTSFAYERAIGSPELFPSVLAEGVGAMDVNTGTQLERSEFSAMESGESIDPSIRFHVEQ